MSGKNGRTEAKKRIGILVKHVHYFQILVIIFKKKICPVNVG